LEWQCKWKLYYTVIISCILHMHFILLSHIVSREMAWKDNWSFLWNTTCYYFNSPGL
jgi:hypothetical protein